MNDKYEVLAAGLRSRINPAYATQVGTESFERRVCAEAIEGLIAERDALAAKLETANLHIKHIGNDALRAENAELLAKFAEIRKQKPIARVADLNNRLMFSLEARGTPRSTNLYLAPSANPDTKDAERLDYLQALIQTSTMTFDDGETKEVNGWCIASAGTDLREALDVLIAQGEQK